MAVGIGVCVGVGVSVGRTIAVAVISATTVARTSGVGVSVGLAIAVAVISATTVARTSGACVGLASAWTTAAGSGSPEDLGSPQLRHKAIANASATGFHNLVVFTQPLLGIHTAGLSPIPPQGSI